MKDCRPIPDRVISLQDIWINTRLNGANAQRPNCKCSTHQGAKLRYLDVIRNILTVGYAPRNEPTPASDGWCTRHLRTVPSAGALFPIEIMAWVSDENSAYVYDIERGDITPYLRPELSAVSLADCGITVPHGESLAAVIVLNARIWTSMKKYGLRGYFYCHLEAGHVARNIDLYMRSFGCRGTIQFRFCQEKLVRILGVEGLCREPIAVFSILKQSPSEENEC